jgi:hypothetical protein
VDRAALAPVTGPITTPLSSVAVKLTTA